MSESPRMYARLSVTLFRPLNEQRLLGNIYERVEFLNLIRIQSYDRRFLDYEPGNYDLF